MYDFYDYKKEDPIADIEYVKGMYDAQVHKVKQEEYMRDLLFADYVKKVRKHISRYDLMENIFKEAQEQVDKKKKKEQQQPKAQHPFKENFVDFSGQETPCFQLF